MEILHAHASNHQPAFILVNSNEWDDQEGAGMEMAAASIAKTSRPMDNEMLSFTWRRIDSPRKGSTLFTMALVLNVDRRASKQICELLENVVPDTATQHRRPLTHNYMLYRTCVSDETTLDEFEATLYLQNHHLSSRYLCTLCDVPATLNFFDRKDVTNARSGMTPAAVLMFDQDWYRHLGIEFDGAIVKIGRMGNGD